MSNRVTFQAYGLLTLTSLIWAGNSIGRQDRLWPYRPHTADHPALVGRHDSDRGTVA